MQKKNFLVVIILILAVIGLTGCRSLGEEKKQVSSTPEISIPLIMMVPDGIEDSKQKALLAHWDLNEGKFSFQQEHLFIKENSDLFSRLIWDGGSRLFACSFGNQKIEGLTKGKADGFTIQNVKINYDPLIIAAIEGSSKKQEILLAYTPMGISSKKSITIESHTGDKVRKHELQLPDSTPDGEVCPLLISGTIDNFTLLALCPCTEANMIQKRLFVAKVQGKQISWQKVSGENEGIIAGAGAELAKSKDKIYISEGMREINLKNQNLKIQNFDTGQALMIGVINTIEKNRRKYQEFYARPEFGTYGDVLLMALNLRDEQWIWAIRNNELVGYLHFNSENKGLQISHGDHVVSQTTLSTQPVGLMLPRDGYGQYK